MKQSREQSLKCLQEGLYFPELPQTHHGQQQNDMELDRTDGPGKTEHLVNHLQLQDVPRDGGFDDGYCL